MMASIRTMVCCGLGIMAAGTVAGAPVVESPLYKDPSVPVERRVEDLLGRMTLREKIAQLSHLHGFQLYNDQEADLGKLREAAGDLGYGCIEGFNLKGANARKAFYAIQRYMVGQTRLGIPALIVSESLHGSVHDGSTIFPQSVALGSTFNTELAYRMTRAIAGELRMQGVSQTLSPGMDVVRDLRWGRVEESFGEDPWLVGQMGIAQVNGYIGGGVWPMLKPFGPGGQPVGGLNLASVESSERDVRTVHIKPYEMVVRATPVKAVMTSYNSWNNIPNSASHFLLTEVLRDEWGFDGYVYSDWGAVEMLRYFQRTAADNADAARQALLAGMDLEASSGCFWELDSLVRTGVLDESYVDRAVRRVLKVKFEMGLFEDPYPGDRAPQIEVRGKEAVALSREIADEAIVLLKNENGLLPIDVAALSSVAVIGPNADQVQFGDYTWSRSNADGVTPLAGIRDFVGPGVKVNYARGCDLIGTDRSGFDEAVAAARASDVSLVFVGSASASLARDYSAATCGEGFDLSSLDLTGAQQELIEAVHAVGKPVVVVLVTGKPFAIPWVKEHVPGIVVQWYGGERAGDAIAAMLFGRTNPSAKLPFSFPQSTGHLPVYYNHLPTDKGFYRQPGSPERPGRDYVFSSPEALWPFGYGLSYTTFEYTDAALSAERLTADDTLAVAVTVRNTGPRDGKEVVQLYVRDLVSSVATPVQQLKAFAKPMIRSGEEAVVELRVPVAELALYDVNMRKVVEDGEFEIQVGSSSGDIRVRKIVTVGARPGAAEDRRADDGTAVAGGSWKAGRKITVTGEIRDVQATPVVGATVRTIRTGKAVTSGPGGRYTITCPENDALTFSAEGFATREIAVGGRKTIDVKLEYQQK